MINNLALDLTETFRDAADLADLLRMGRLPESWIALRLASDQGPR